jgi:hypothetical protein
MEQRSQYLAQLLQQMAPKQSQAAFQYPTPQFARPEGQGDQPRHSVFQNLRQAGQNIADLPGRIAQAPQGMAANVGSLFGLGRAAKGG